MLGSVVCTGPMLDSDIAFPMGAGAAVVVTISTVLAGATAHPWLALTALTAVSAVVAAATTLWASLATTAVCWALHTGFVLNRYGELTLDARTDHAAIVLAAATFTVATIVRGRSLLAKAGVLQVQNALDTAPGGIGDRARLEQPVQLRTLHPQ